MSLPRSATWRGVRVLLRLLPLLGRGIVSLSLLLLLPLLESLLILLLFLLLALLLLFLLSLLSSSR